MHLIQSHSIGRYSRWIRGLTTRGTHFPRNTSRPREETTRLIAINTFSISVRKKKKQVQENKIERYRERIPRVSRVHHRPLVDVIDEPCYLYEYEFFGNRTKELVALVRDFADTATIFKTVKNRCE